MTSPIRTGSCRLDGDQRKAGEVDDGIKVNWEGWPAFSWRSPGTSGKGRYEGQSGNGPGSGPGCFAVVGDICCHLMD